MKPTLTITTDTVGWEWENLIRARVSLGERAIVHFENPTVTPQMLASRLGCSHPTIVRAINAGKLRAIKAGKRWRIDPADADKFAADFFKLPGQAG